MLFSAPTIPAVAGSDSMELQWAKHGWGMRATLDIGGKLAVWEIYYKPQPHGKKWHLTFWSDALAQMAGENRGSFRSLTDAKTAAGLIAGKQTANTPILHSGTNDIEMLSVLGAS